MREGHAGTLVGRDREVAIGRDVLADPASRVLVVSGPAGVGKSRLLDELLPNADDGPVLLRTRAHAMDEELTLAALVPALVGHLDELAGPRRREVLEGLGSLADVLEGYGLEPPPDNGALGDRSRLARTRRLEAMRRLLLRLAADPTRNRRDQRLLLVVDDAHWADRATLETLAHLGRSPSSTPVTLVLTHRDDEVGPALATTLADLRRAPGHAELRLGLLDVDEIAALVADRTDEAADDRLVGWLAERSGGLPLFVHGLLDELLGADGASARARLPARVDPTDRVVVPAVARDVFRPRLDALDDRARRVLDATAVAGGPVSLAQLGRVLSDDVASVAAAVDTIVDAHLAATVPGGAVDLVHSLVRDVVLDALGAATRRTLHAGFAADLRANDPDQLARTAFHVRHAGHVVAPRDAFDLLLEAGTAAADRYDGAPAVANLSAALELLDAGLVEHDRGPVLRALARGMAEENDPRAIETIAAARAALAEEGRALEVALATAEHATFAYHSGDRVGCLELIRLASQLHPEPRSASAAWLHLRLAHLGLGLRDDTAVAEAHEAMEAAVGDDADEEALVLRSLVRAWRAQLDADAVGADRHAREAMERSQGGRHGMRVGAHYRALTVRAETAAFLGDLATVEDAVATTVAVGVDRRAPQMAWRPLQALAHLCTDRGDLERADDVARRIRASLDSYDLELFVKRLDAWRALAAEDRPAASAATDAFAEMGSLLDVDGVAAEVGLLRCGIALLGGDDVDGEPPSPPLTLSWAPLAAWWTLGVHAARTGDRVTAKAVAEHLGRMPDDTLPHVVAPLVRAELDATTTGELLDAAALAERLGAKRWTVLLCLAAAELADDDEEVADHARAALVGAEQLELPRSADRARALLRSVGERVGRAGATATGTAVLTPRQREIAALVAEGLSNAEVAEQLFISVRTVTTHLDHIYTRLDLGSRTALAAWWHREQAEEA